MYLTTTGRRTGLPREIEIWFTRRGTRYYSSPRPGSARSGSGTSAPSRAVRWQRRARGLHSGRARVLDPARDAALGADVRARSVAKYGWGDGLIVELRPGRARRRRG